MDAELVRCAGCGLELDERDAYVTATPYKVNTWCEQCNPVPPWRETGIWNYVDTP